MQINADHPDLINAVRSSVAAALAEDVGDGDITAELINADERAVAEVITREPGVFCGVPWIRETCRQVDERLEIDLEIADGDVMRAGQVLFSLHGPARGLLTAERTLLNFVQLLSGTATRTQRYAALDKKADACAGCAAPCASACPHGVPIPERMAGAHDLLTLA